MGCKRDYALAQSLECSCFYLRHPLIFDKVHFSLGTSLGLYLVSSIPGIANSLRSQSLLDWLGCAQHDMSLLPDNKYEYIHSSTAPPRWPPVLVQCSLQACFIHSSTGCQHFLGATAPPAGNVLCRLVFSQLEVRAAAGARASTAPWTSQKFDDRFE